MICEPHGRPKPCGECQEIALALEERDRYKAALEEIAYGPWCGEDTTEKAKEALRPEIKPKQEG
jgi:hypothetical protein